MRFFIQILAATMLAALGACSGVPQQREPLASLQSYGPIADGQPTGPPPGFVSFCIHNLKVCARNPGAPAAVVMLTDQTKANLLAINSFVNNSIAYEPDSEQFGVANRWNLHAVGRFGDCKDYALAKQQALIAAGLPASALRIAIVKTPTDELHAVLTVDTDNGDLVLDSLTSSILPWPEAHYTWLSRQSQMAPLQWVAISPNQISMVADQATPRPGVR